MRNVAHEWMCKRETQIEVQYDVNEMINMTLKYIQFQSETAHSSNKLHTVFAIIILDREWIKRMENASQSQYTGECILCML